MNDTAYLKQLAEGSKDSLISHLEIVYKSISDKEVIGGITVKKCHLNPLGFLHGGMSAVLQETLASVGGNYIVRDTGQKAVGIELNCSHLRPAREGDVIEGTASLIRLGKNLQIWQIDLHNQHGKKISVSRCTLFTS